jgi:Flp pilus assembly protein TadD
VQSSEPEPPVTNSPTPKLPNSSTLKLSNFPDKLPFLLLSGISCAVTISAQGGAVGGLHLPLSERVGNAVMSYGRYLLKMVWPTRLVVLYPISPRFPFWQLALAILGVGCLSWLAIRCAKHSPYLFTGWFWFLGTLVPVIGIVQVGLQSMADRYTYIPSIGLFIIVAWGGYDLLHRWRLPPAATAVLAVLPVAACILVTRAQLSHWKDSVALFQHTLRWTTNNYIAENNLGLALMDRGETRAARQHLEQAIRICPTDADAWSNLGAALVSEGKLDEAITCYHKAIQLQPRDPDFHHNLACALVRLGGWKEAIAELETSLRIDPDPVPVHADLARSFDAVGRVPDAETQWKLVLDREPDNVEALFRLGFILAAERDFEGARRHLERAARLRPGDPEVRLQLGGVLLALGSNDEAGWQLSEAARIDPTNVVARFNLALVLERLGRAREAVDQYREVVSLDPRMAAALNNLAWILASNPDPKVRNGAEAVQFAEQACRLAGYRDARLITTLAVAYAEAGRFQDAAGTAAKAEALAQQAGSAQLAGEYRKLGDLFRSGQPYHPTAPSK